MRVVSAVDGKTVATLPNAETPSRSPDDREIAFRRDDGVIIAPLAEP